MNAVLALAPLVAAAALVVALLVSLVALWRRYQHPRRILLRALSAGSLIGLLGIVGIVPAVLWWVPWVLALATVGGTVLACRRLLVADPPVEPTARQAKDLARPAAITVIGEVGVYVALVAVALAGG